jgi:hypothetical protein
MKSWALNVGTRYFLSDSGTARTYVAGYLGADRMDAMTRRSEHRRRSRSRARSSCRSATRFDAGVEGGLGVGSCRIRRTSACPSARSTSMRARR